MQAETYEILASLPNRQGTTAEIVKAAERIKNIKVTPYMRSTMVHELSHMKIARIVAYDNKTRSYRIIDDFPPRNIAQ